MSYILCRNASCDTPFYIENISTNIYSIEELCFYLYHNLYLLDETILNEKLCFWLRDELKLTGLSERMLQLLDGDASLSEIILPVFKEIHYLSHEEFRIFSAKLNQLEVQSPILRQKMKGDYLYQNGKFVNAVAIYKSCMTMEISDNTGTQFLGSIYYNMGCAYSRLFQMGEARGCFEKAFDMIHSRQALIALLTAVYMDEGEETMETMAEGLGLDDTALAELKTSIEELYDAMWESESGKRYLKLRESLEMGDTHQYNGKMKRFLRELTEDYHRSTGF